MTEGNGLRVSALLDLREDKVMRTCSAGSRRLPDGLDSRHLALRHGPVVRRILLWVGRARARRQLARPATEAPDERLLDMGLTRQTNEREAAGWFWEEMEVTQGHRRNVRQADG